MNRGELMNCAVCIVIGFLLYSFIQNGFCGKNLVEGLKPDTPEWTACRGGTKPGGGNYADNGATWCQNTSKPDWAKYVAKHTSSTGHQCSSSFFGFCPWEDL